MMQIRDFVQSNEGLKPEKIVSEINIQIERIKKWWLKQFWNTNSYSMLFIPM